MVERIFIKTYGCSLNRYFSEKLSKELCSKGYFVLNQPFGSDLKIFNNEEEFLFLKNADFLILNTCTLSEYAEKNLILGGIKESKKINPKLKMVLCGCSIKNKNSILKKVKATFKSDHIEEILDFFTKKMEKGDFLVNRKNNRIVLIKENCSNSCSYCICQYKGKQKKIRSFKDISLELKKLKKEGIETIEFGGPCYSEWVSKKNEKKSFLDILEMACKSFFIQNLEIHPKDFSKKLMKILKKNQKKIKDLSIPIQHASGKVLKSMKRGYTKEDLEKILKKIETLKDLSITTDIIVGYPGETEKDWIELITFLKKHNFKRIDLYRYSPRIGTLAFNFPDRIKKEVIKKRIKLIIKDNKLSKEVSIKEKLN